MALPPFADTDGLFAASRGFNNTATKNATTSLDFAIGSEDRWMHGGELILNNHVTGDKYTFQIVDKDYVYAGVANSDGKIMYPATAPGGVAWSTAAPTGIVLNEFRTDWNVAGDVSTQTLINYNFKAKIYSGLYLRIIYTSIGIITNVTVMPNLLLVRK